MGCCLVVWFRNNTAHLPMRRTMITANAWDVSMGGSFSLKIVSLSILKRGTIEQVVVSMVPFVCATIGCPALAATVRWELSLYVVLDALRAVSEAAGFDIAVHFGVHRQASLA